MTEKKAALAPAAAVEEAAAVAPSITADAAPEGIVRPFVRVVDLNTGHEYDVHRQALDPDVHRLVKDVEDTWTPRPATPNPNPGPVKG